MPPLEQAGGGAQQRVGVAGGADALPVPELVALAGADAPLDSPLDLVSIRPGHGDGFGAAKRPAVEVERSVAGAGRRRLRRRSDQRPPPRCARACPGLAGCRRRRCDLPPGVVLDRACSYQSPTADPLSPPSPCGRALASVGMWHRDEREFVDAGEGARVAGVRGRSFATATEAISTSRARGRSSRPPRRRLAANRPKVPAAGASKGNGSKAASVSWSRA